MTTAARARFASRAAAERTKEEKDRPCRRAAFSISLRSSGSGKRRARRVDRMGGSGVGGGRDGLEA